MPFGAFVMSIISVNHTVLDSLKNYLAQITPDQFRQPLPLYNGSSFGEHTRHIIEFYQCLVMQASQGWVSYDLRQRNKQLQEEPLLAIAAIEQVQQQFASMLLLDSPLMLLINPTTEGDNVQQIASTFYRELLYVLDHAIHHMALIKIGINTLCINIVLPADFGVAPSTIRSRQTQAIVQ